MTMVGMDNETKRLFRLAQLKCEDAVVDVIDDYFEEHDLLDGGEELIARVSRVLGEQFEAAQRGEYDALLATWRHGGTIN